MIARRQLLQLATAGMLAEPLHVLAEGCSNGTHGSAAAEAKPYTAQFFTSNEIALLDRVMEAILPADEHSPGAQKARTSLFADLLVATTDDGTTKQDWRTGLRLLAAELQHTELDDWLQKAASHEDSPQSPLDLFFVTLKQTTVEGYYTSAIGIHQDLQYVGNTYSKEFKGCTHAEHQS